MNLKETLKVLLGGSLFFAVSILLLYVLSGFGDRPRLADDGAKRQILHIANGSEPSGIDTHLTTGVTEHAIQMALTEGLVSEDPVNLDPVPGIAHSWDTSEDGTVYTFHLRDALWSNGDPITAQDFVLSFKRALSPKLGNEYTYMLYYLVNGEAFFKGEVEFNEVGAKALDDKTLQLTINEPTPFFLSLLNHHSWYPVHVATVLENGDLDSRSNKWAREDTFVGNGPFVIDEWKVNNVFSVRKNPLYWDADRVKLQGIRFYPLESLDTEERAFRAGQVHKTDKLPLPKIPFYIERNDPNLLLAPYLGSYHYSINTTRPPFNDKRVRQALSLSIDRESIVKNVSRAGEQAAYSIVPPDCAGYTPRQLFEKDIVKAQRLLAEAGFPGGEGFPEFNILYNTLESHKSIAEAIQQMWRKNLGIDVGLENQEWKVYLTSKMNMDYDIARYGWIGDYVDPTTFLGLYTSYSGNNNSGWGSQEYDDLLAKAAKAKSLEERMEYFHQAEKILADESPFIPIYYYMSSYLLDSRIKGWYPNLLDHHPYKYVYFEE
ncbi:peptide ABC transporter substrate-binding protein [Puniceicoccaceae bacterium K14]|nr:peptide ABC transporter substrate-binding protein [Puniceicoccaceae bacterium K14]